MSLTVVPTCEPDGDGYGGGGQPRRRRQRRRGVTTGTDHSRYQYRTTPGVTRLVLLGKAEDRDLVQVLPDRARGGVAGKGPFRAGAAQGAEVGGHRPGGVVVLGQRGRLPRWIVAFHRAPAGLEQVAHPVPAPVGGAQGALSARLHDGDRPRAGLAGRAAGA